MNFSVGKPHGDPYIFGIISEENLKKRGKALKEIQDLDELLKIDLSDHVSVFGKADTLFRQGAYQKALSLLAPMCELGDSSLLGQSAVQMRSVILGHLGRGKEALQELETLILMTARGGISPYLADLNYFASIASRFSPQESLPYLQKAIQLYSQMGDKIQEGSFTCTGSFSKNVISCKSS